MAQTTYMLTLEEEHILWMLDGNPSNVATIRDAGLLSLCPKLQERGLIWFNLDESTFMLTTDGVRHLRAVGKKKLLPHLHWKDDKPTVIVKSRDGKPMKKRQLKPPTPKKKRHV